jgi:hypothetical protein
MLLLCESHHILLLIFPSWIIFYHEVIVVFVYKEFLFWTHLYFILINWILEVIKLSVSHRWPHTWFCEDWRCFSCPDITFVRLHCCLITTYFNLLHRRIVLSFLCRDFVLSSNALLVILYLFSILLFFLSFLVNFISIFSSLMF